MHEVVVELVEQREEELGGGPAMEAATAEPQVTVMTIMVAEGDGEVTKDMEVEIITEEDTVMKDMQHQGRGVVGALLGKYEVV